MENNLLNDTIIFKDVSRDPMHKYYKYKNMNSIKNLIKYILTEKESGKHVRFFGGTGVEYYSFEKSYKQMKAVKRYFKKLDGIQVWHYVLSFPVPPSEENVYEAYEIACDVLDVCFSGYQTIFGIHENEENLHIHFMINSVSYIDGKKWHLDKKQFRRLIYRIKDSIKNILYEKVSSMEELIN